MKRFMKQISSYIDHTLLKPEATARDIVKICREAVENRFYAVCINPSHVKTAAKELQGSGVLVCAVVGFPLGATTCVAKAFETAEAVENGADEIDMVMHIGALKNGDQNYLFDDISGVIRAARGKIVKVIIETGLLSKQEIVLACRLAKEAGADFVKTSTGFGPGGATASDLRLMRETVGPAMGIKASGGVRTAAAVWQMIEAGATRIGTSSGSAIVSEQRAEK